ncbi:MAG: phycobiliprotein lyase [Cyanobacteriota bacterium]|nr:phycobiliprotein lyase [Cyanobacteriota bacterium]
MNIHQFFTLSLGCWRSQRSGHDPVSRKFDEIYSTANITLLDAENPEALELCEQYDIDPSQTLSPLCVDWHNESRATVTEDRFGRYIVVPVPDPYNINEGYLLRSPGFPETLASESRYELGEDGTFVETVHYRYACGEKRIWFATPNLRLKVSIMRANDGNGLATPSFSSEVRDPTAVPSRFFDRSAIAV